MRPILRHVVVAATTGALVLLFAWMRAGAHPVHQWNRAWADASLLLLAALFVMGPAARMHRRLGGGIAWRRALGVWAFVAAVAHVYVYAAGALHYDWLRFVMDDRAFRKDTIAAANWIGFLSLGFGVLPLLTSNDWSQRILGRAWVRLQSQGRFFYVLAMAHFLLFWVMVYGKDPVAPVLFWGVFGVVAGSETAAVGVELVRRRSPTGKTQ